MNSFFQALLRVILRWFDQLTVASLLRAFLFTVAGIFALYYVVRRGIFYDPSIPVSDLTSLLTGVLAIIGGLVVLKLVWDVQKESTNYAQKISRTGTSTQPPEIARLLARLQESNSQQIRDSVEQLRKELEASKASEIDTSDPNKLFRVGRQRLLDEAVRLDSISRRNLVIGILFSATALTVVALPLTETFFPTPDELRYKETTAWLVHYYLPRLGVGILLQFVGFFFLRLYVANELDLKHNKNEITNYELRMMALQLATTVGDNASRKEVIKSLAHTERNFILKRNEKSVSTEALAEYNDIKGFAEKLLNKLPSAKTTGK